MSEIADPRVQKSRQSIMEAAVDVLLEKGWPGVNISAICTRARLSRSTFYDHFQFAEEPVWEYALEKFFQKHANLVLGPVKLDPDSLLLGGKPLSWPLFDHVWENRELYQYILSPEGGVLWPKVLDRVAQISRRLHEPIRTMATQEQDPELIATYLSGAILGVLRWWVNAPVPPTPVSMAYWFSAMAAPGLLSLQGISDAD